MVGTVSSLAPLGTGWVSTERPSRSRYLRKGRAYMASPTSVVYVEKPANILLSEYFVEMRIWLDAHNITPLELRLFGGLRVGFEIRFSGPEQASFFEREFGANVYPTTVAPLI